MLGNIDNKILILGGAYVHNKLVKAAHELGLYVIVSDYLNPLASPAKLLADEFWNINITEIDLLAEKCRNNNVKAVLSCFLDPCQKPYQMLCEKLGLNCYGTKEQFMTFTDKHAFKDFLKKNNVSTIPEYTIQDIESDNVDYPVYVKPVDSRGSRGQTVCYCKKDVIEAIDIAKSLSSNGNVIIEKYMREKPELQITYFVNNGIPHLVRLSDCYVGSINKKMDKFHLVSKSPSIYLNDYLQHEEKKVSLMIQNLGIKNGPVFMQGFYDDGKYRFFDPGLRFPGADYELILKAATNCDLLQAMVKLALYGECGNIDLTIDDAKLHGKVGVLVFPVIRAGKIASIKGVEEIKNDPRVISYQQRYNVNDVVEWTYDVNQRFNEINILGNTEEDVIDVLNKIKGLLKVIDINGEDMIYEWPDFSVINNKE